MIILKLILSSSLYIFPWNFIYIYIKLALEIMPVINCVEFPTSTYTRKNISRKGQMNWLNTLGENMYLFNKCLLINTISCQKF